MSTRAGMTKQELDTLRSLRNRGYAVIVWTPDELQEADAQRVEDRSIELGWDIIATLQTDWEELK